MAKGHSKLPTIGPLHLVQLIEVSLGLDEEGHSKQGPCTWCNWLRRAMAWMGKSHSKPLAFGPSHLMQLIEVSLRSFGRE